MTKAQKTKFNSMLGKPFDVALLNDGDGPNNPFNPGGGRAGRAADRERQPGGRPRRTGTPAATGPPDQGRRDPGQRMDRHDQGIVRDRDHGSDQGRRRDEDGIDQGRRHDEAQARVA